MRFVVVVVALAVAGALPGALARGRGGHKHKRHLESGTWVKDPGRDGLDYAARCQRYNHRLNCPAERQLHRWGWRPAGEDAPLRFDREQVFSMAWNKILFVGDAAARAQFESLVCLLDDPMLDDDVVDVDEDRTRFPRFDPKKEVRFVHSKFLVRHEEVVDPVSGKTSYYLDIDQVDMLWARAIKRFDVIVIDTGAWHHQRNLFVLPPADSDTPELLTEPFEALERATRTALTYLRGHYTGKLVWRSYAPCHSPTLVDDRPSGSCGSSAPNPVANPDPFMIQADAITSEVIREYGYAVLNISALSVQREDAHPLGVNDNNPFVTTSDCCSYCLPGLPDTWNELLVREIPEEFAEELFPTAREQSPASIEAGAHKIESMFFSTLIVCTVVCTLAVWLRRH